MHYNQDDVDNVDNGDKNDRDDTDASDASDDTDGNGDDIGGNNYDDDDFDGKEDERLSCTKSQSFP